MKENEMVKFGRKMATPVTQVNIMYTADIDFSPRADLTLDIMQRCLQIAYTDSVREDKGGTYGIGVSFELDKDVKAAVADGYKNAFSAIFDSNLTSVITGIILFFNGSGPIKGFATTYIIGIACCSISSPV